MAEQEKESAAAAAPAKKSGGSSVALVLLVSVAAGAAAFGGTKLGGKAVAAAPAHHEVKPPGPTLTLEPFVLGMFDKDGKSHAIRIAIAIEFDSHAKEDDIKKLVPRVRDATLTQLRTLTFEQAIDPAGMEKLRTALLERLKTAGAANAERILLTDLVVQ